MSIVKYRGNGVNKVFDVEQALKDGGWPVLHPKLYPLKMVDRNNPKHTAIIENIRWDSSYGMVFVQWRGGGWNCLDHAIEQFKPAT